MNMNPYSKINVIGKNKSRSMDFSDLTTCPEPEPTKTNLHTNTKETSLTLQEAANKIKKDNMRANTNTKEYQDSSSVPEDQIDQESTADHVQGFGTTTVVLKRNSSISAASASALQSAVRRAFSMRRSSSVSERYCRIHDQSATLTSPNHDEDGFTATMERTRSVKKKSSRGRIFRACKKLFGL